MIQGIIANIAKAGSGLASAAQGALRAGAGVLSSAMGAVRGVGGVAAKAPSAARGAVQMGQYVASAGSRAAGAAQSAGQAAGQAGQAAAQQVKAHAGQATNSVQSFLQNAANSFKSYAQQILQIQVGGGGKPPVTPPTNNAPPAANNPGGGKQPSQPATVGTFLGNQLRLFARQTASSALGNTIGGGLQIMRLGQRYLNPVTGGFNVIKDVAGKGGEAITWLAKLPGRLKDFGDALVRSRDHLKEYNGSIAAAVAKLEVERIGRNIRLGAATGKSAGFQTAAQSRLENNMLPMQAILTNLTNIITGGIQNGVSYGLERLGGAIAKVPGFAGAAKALQDMAKEKEGDMALTTLLASMPWKVQNTPARFRPPIGGAPPPPSAPPAGAPPGAPPKKRRPRESRVD